MRRGEIWVASFRPWRGKEVGKARPSVVLQADWLSLEDAGTVIVLPLTSQLWSGADALRLEIAPRERLRQPSWVMIDKIQALDIGRFKDGPLATLSDQEMHIIEQRLRSVLGFI